MKAGTMFKAWYITGSKFLKKLDEGMRNEMRKTFSSQFISLKEDFLNQPLRGTRACSEADPVFPMCL